MLWSGVLLASAGATQAGIISRACIIANRSAASKELCQCIDRVAQSSLNKSERKKASKFFSDPHRAQVVRQSDRRSDEIFWKRYKAFGERADKTCNG